MQTKICQSKNTCKVGAVTTERRLHVLLNYTKYFFSLFFLFFFKVTKTKHPTKNNTKNNTKIQTNHTKNTENKIFLINCKKNNTHTYIHTHTHTHKIIINIPPHTHTHTHIHTHTHLINKKNPPKKPHHNVDESTWHIKTKVSHYQFPIVSN